MNEQAEQLLHDIKHDIESNRIILPSLPEVALRVRQLTADENCDIRQLEREIAKDAAITARLIKVTNSSAMRRGNSVTSLRLAISTLGFSLVRSFVTQMAILQIMNNSADKQRLLGFVASGLRISALSNSLAKVLPGLDPEHAALAGLLHDIGKLPLRGVLQRRPELTSAEAAEMEILLHPEVGALMLHFWKMDSSLVEVAREHESILRDPAPTADYVDVVIAANIIHYGTDSGRYAAYAGTAIPALEKCTINRPVVTMGEDIEQRMTFARTLISA